MIKIQLIIFSRLLKTYKKKIIHLSQKAQEQDRIVLFWVFLVPHITNYFEITNRQTTEQKCTREASKRYSDEWNTST